MARTKSLPISTKISVVDWLSEARPLRIADYQRPYSWGEKLIVSFTDSILRGLYSTETGESPDIGVIVIEETPNCEFIADGQQRIMTFALLMIEALHLKAKFLPGCKLGSKSRLASLVNSSTSNVTTLQNTIVARRHIRSVLAKYPEFMRLKTKEKLDLLRESISMAPIVLKNPSSAEPDPLITQLFRDINTVAKQLNGGQILKAEHLGKIHPRRLRASDRTRSVVKTSEIQARYEKWRRTHQADGALFLDSFTPRCLNTREEISLELFIDCPDERCWSWLGYGFVQAVQAILLKQDLWWMEIAYQDHERLEPFERLIGTKDGEPDEDTLLPEFKWNAAEPLEIERGDGFFQTVNRIGLLYTDYYERLLALLEKVEYKSSQEIICSPGALVCEAAEKLASFFRVIGEAYREDVPDSLSWKWLSVGDDSDVFNQDLADPATWLAIDPLRRPGANLPSATGCLPTALFAVALCWCDRFGTNEKIRSKRDIRRHFRFIPPQASEAIQQLLVLLMLKTKFMAQYRSTLSQLNLKESIEAAEFSRNPESALWRFYHTSKGPSPFQRDWLEGLEQILIARKTRLFGDDSDLSIPIDQTVLNVISTFLNR